MSFTILTVCTGNICRSPVASFLLSKSLGPEVRVFSAGTQALVGHSIHPHMAALLSMDTSRFAAQQLTPRLIRDADLVLGSMRFHRSRIVELYPPALRRTFTLREFARIVQVAGPHAGGTAGDVLAELTRRAPHLRTASKAVAELDDIPDPFGLNDEAFAECYALIHESVESIAIAVQARGVTSAKDVRSQRPRAYDWWDLQA